MGKMFLADLIFTLPCSTKPFEINEIKTSRRLIPAAAFLAKSLIDRGLKADIIPTPNTLCHLVDGIELT
jgi:hypothetical protein